MTDDRLFIRACKGEKTERTPIWLMRQAGRYLPEYRELKKEYNFFELCTNPAMIKDITLMPIKRYPLDAAIIFSDITLPLYFSNRGLRFDPGPIFERPIRTSDDMLDMRKPDLQDLHFLGKGIELVKKELNKKYGNLPLIGFGGAPFTLTSYLIEGGHSKNFTRTKRFMWENEQVFRELMEMVTESVIQFLNYQIDNGVDAVQLFDTWAGVLSPPDYRKLVLPYTKRVYEAVEDRPFIHFLKGSSHLLPYMKEAGDIMGIDWSIEIKDVIKILGSGFPIQGNLDPAILFAPEDIIKQRVLDILTQARDTPHIFNLGHGILPDTPPESVKYLIEAVHSFGKTE